MAIRVDGEPAALAGRLRELAAEIDAEAMLEEPQTLSQQVADERTVLRWVLLAIGVVAGIAIVLSVAGLYALMSFTVAQRTREIGVRSALGADVTGIVTVIAKRAMSQLTGGVLLGLLLSVGLTRGFVPELFVWVRTWWLLLGGAALAVLLVGAVACVAPTLRGLRIEPMEAFRV